MHDTSVGLLVLAAAGTGALHTALGVDHTLPFVLIARGERWTLGRLWTITLLCGAGHVLSSLALGLLGIGFGVTVERAGWIESARAATATWLLVGFGLAYAAWGAVRSLRRRSHAHTHAHGDGAVHVHAHDHQEDHLHPHRAEGGGLAAWALFIVLVFGPCEPLIPLLMVSAMTHGGWAAAIVTASFAVATIGTMLALVTLGFRGLGSPGLSRLEPHAETIAGVALVVTGLAMRWLGP